MFGRRKRKTIAEKLDDVIERLQRIEIAVDELNEDLEEIVEITNFRLKGVEYEIAFKYQSSPLYTTEKLYVAYLNEQNLLIKLWAISDNAERFAFVDKKYIELYDKEDKLILVYKLEKSKNALIEVDLELYTNAKNRSYDCGGSLNTAYPETIEENENN